jgi:hypothetical protein
MTYSTVFILWTHSITTLQGGDGRWDGGASIRFPSGDDVDKGMGKVMGNLLITWRNTGEVDSQEGPARGFEYVNRLA